MKKPRPFPLPSTIYNGLGHVLFPISCVKGVLAVGTESYWIKGEYLTMHFMWIQLRIM